MHFVVFVYQLEYSTARVFVSITQWTYVSKPIQARN